MSARTSSLIRTLTLVSIWAFAAACGGRTSTNGDAADHVDASLGERADVVVTSDAIDTIRTDTGGCATGETSCSGACVNVATDPMNCGACGMICPSGVMCIAGVCSPS